ncbi:hypothetical protein NLI96_g4136 [Meripilus lineatus]|uniref:Uncharacterized protein n=1 Tax=Meripilus lineatus TaxID=2056292 RepID=A0AAD5VAU5_9APHY|nr:hypothetical protein NLI96_g4136 [Physisporinus lineatus]
MNPTHDRYPKDGHIRDDDDDEFDKESPYVAEKRLPEPRLLDLDLPHSELDLTMTFDSILSEGVSHQKPFTPEEQKVQKRASNVLKLSQENEKLQEELRAMTERLEAAERKQRELAQKNQSRGASASSPSS